MLSCDLDRLNISFTRPLEATNDFFTIGLPVVSEEKSFEIVDGRTGARRTMGPVFIESCPGAFSSNELKSIKTGMNNRH